MKLLIIFFLAVAALRSPAQNRGYDTLPYVLEFHQKKIDEFSKEPIMKGKVIFLGNSITAFGDWKHLLNDSTIVNRGIPGDITFGILNRLSDVISRQPSKLFIKIGMNDISKNIPDNVIVENIVSIVHRVKKESPTTKIFVQSILPTNDSVKTHYPDAFGKNDHVVLVNNKLKKAAKKEGYIFIDLYSKFHDENGKLDFKYSKNDGIHLNAEGYHLWVMILRQGKYL
ncbi:MAG: GDSL-type esterase/lipase family protein [Chitinophagaceae bacterium]